MSGVAETGIRAGYQTMDVLAAMAFGIIILKSAQDKGYADGKGKTKMISGAALLAGGLLLIVYLGLTYLGATVSGRFNIHITRAELVTVMSQSEARFRHQDPKNLEIVPQFSDVPAGQYYTYYV